MDLVRAKRFFKHTRIVTSGNYPLYRLMALAAVVSGIVQISMGKIPPSVSLLYRGLPDYWDYIFMLAQLIGGVLILVAVYMETDDNPSSDRMHLSLTIELIGLYFLLASILVYTFGVIFQNKGLPITMTSWFGIAMFIYGVKRFAEIRAGLRKMRSS